MMARGKGGGKAGRLGRAALFPETLPWGWGVLLPGYSDALALEHGMLATDLAVEEARARKLPGVSIRLKHFRHCPHNCPDTWSSRWLLETGRVSQGKTPCGETAFEKRSRRTLALVRIL